MVYELSNKESKRKWRQSHLKEIREYQKFKLNTAINYRRSHLFSGVKSRAKKKEIEFDLVFSEIEWPEVCPILNIQIDYMKRDHTDDSPSFDRVDPTKGYTKDNVRIISLRANQLKNNGTLDQFKSIIHYMENHFA